MTALLTGSGLHNGRVVCIFRADVGYIVKKESDILNVCEMETSVGISTK